MPRRSRPTAERYGAELGDPVYSDDAWAAKLDVLLDLRPEVASFTFGLPSDAGMQAAQRRGHHHGRHRDVASTKPTPRWPAASTRIAVQCASAGGHRGTFDPSQRRTRNRCPNCSPRVRARVSVPVIAAGGLVTADDVNRVMSAGAVAAQLGTAFLLADEAGSSPVHRAALQDPQFTETVVTKSFSGRYARGLRNRFIDEHEAQAPFGYPEIHYLTGPLRAASVRAGDPHGTNVWAGTGFTSIRTGSVAEIMSGLA